MQATQPKLGKPRLMHRVFSRIQKTSLWFDSRFTAAGRLLVLGLIISTVYALDPRQTSAYQLAATLTATLLVAYILSFRRSKSIEVQRLLPHFFTRGEPGSYLIRLTNKGPQHINNISLREHLSPGSTFALHDGAIDSSKTISWLERKMGFLPWLNTQRIQLGVRVSATATYDVPIGDTITIKQTITPLRRGVLYFAGADIRQTENLGMMRQVRHYTQRDKVLVLPPRIELPKVAWQSQRMFHRGGVSVASTVGDSQEFIGLRDYRAGDPLRQIHWRSFAKLGRPIVKEFQDEYFDHHALVLDREILPEQEALFETATSVAVSFVQTKQPDDSLLDLVLVGDFSWRATAGRGASDKMRLLEHLAVVSASKNKDGTRTDTGGFEQQMQRLLNCNSVVLITCHWDAHCQQAATKLRQTGIDLLGLCIGEQQESFSDHYQLDAAQIVHQLPALLSSLNRGN